jgi:2',3'-cyclic-nucleotide 2'-phosphodiesterase (5'-nucleotidase family)
MARTAWKEAVEQAPFAFLAQNVRDIEWREPVFPGSKIFEKGGVKIAVIGQAFPRTPISNPRWMIPGLGVRHPRSGDAETGRRCAGGRRGNRRRAVAQWI